MVQRILLKATVPAAELRPSAVVFKLVVMFGSLVMSYNLRLLIMLLT